MLDELTIFNLSVKYPNTIDLVREVEKMARADAIDDCLKIIKDNIDYIETEEEIYRTISIETIQLLEQLKEQK